jgi:hopene-associated glycosyltransferase HpnB
LLVESLSLLVLIFWIALSLDRSRAWPAECFLSGLDPGAEEGDRPAIVAVVPARDESTVLPETLPSLLEQDLPGFTVVLVDDGSTDGTGELARGLAGEVGRQDRLRIVAAPSTPAGWTGKVHALACGVATTTTGGHAPEWLLLTDADIRHRPGALRALLAKAHDGSYDLVSVMARLHARSFWERLIVPPFVFFFHLLYPFRSVQRNESPVAAAAGGCVLVRRALLEAAGGLASIRDALIDDVALARLIKKAGGRLWLGFDPGIFSVRPYRGLPDLWRMIDRSAFTQLRYRWDLLLAVVVGLGLLFAAPPFLALAAAGPTLSALGGAGRAAPPTGALISATLAWGLAARTLLPYVRHHRVPPIYALGLPLASLLYALMSLSSGWRHLRGRGGEWKGRTYPGTVE